MPMLRPRVITESDVAAAQMALGKTGVGAAVTTVAEKDPYTAKLVKYIPAEIVAAYLAVSGGFASLNSPWAPWLSLTWVAILAVLTPIWIQYATSDPKLGIAAHRFQIYSATVAFLVWAFALGGAWLKLLPPELQTLQPAIGAMAVTAATLIIPLVDGEPRATD